jgi:hypothetical protein
MFTRHNIPEIQAKIDRFNAAIRQRNLLVLAAAGYSERDEPDDFIEIDDLESYIGSGQHIADYMQEDRSDVAAQLYAEGILDAVSAAGTPPPKKIIGDLAQTSVSEEIQFSGTTSATTGVTGIASTANLSIGMPISGAGIPDGTTIAAIPSGTTLTLSQAATASATITLTVIDEEQVISLGEWTIDVKRKTVDATDTDSGAWEEALGSTKSWSGKSKYLFVDGDESQADQIFSMIDDLEADAATWNFFPTVASGRAVWQGEAIIDGITLAGGVGKLFGLDVSLKGTGPLRRLTQSTPVANANTITGEQAEV